MKNIELKVAVKDFKEITNSLKKNQADFKGKFSQVDTYYNFKNKRLKIRGIDHKIYQLITYYRYDQAGFKISDYTIKYLNQKELKYYKQHLGRLYGESVKVSKKRELWIYKNTRIHLDKIRGIGKFLELETVVNNSLDFKNLEEEHRKIINLLHLSHYKKINKSYSDLLLVKKHLRKESTSSLFKHPKTFPV